MPNPLISGPSASPEIVPSPTQVDLLSGRPRSRATMDRVFQLEAEGTERGTMALDLVAVPRILLRDVLAGRSRNRIRSRKVASKAAGDRSGNY